MRVEPRRAQISRRQASVRGQFQVQTVHPQSQGLLQDLAAVGFTPLPPPPFALQPVGGDDLAGPGAEESLKIQALQIIQPDFRPKPPPRGP